MKKFSEQGKNPSEGKLLSYLDTTILHCWKNTFAEEQFSVYLRRESIWEDKEKEVHKERWLASRKWPICRVFSTTLYTFLHRSLPKDRH